MKSRTISFGLVIVIVVLLSACSGEVNGVPEPQPAPREIVENGRRLIASYGCGSCHTILGVPGADSMAAPALKRFYERSYIAGKLPNTTKNLIRYIKNPQQVEPGSAMPDLGVTEDEAEAIAAYLYHQPTIVDLIGR